MCQTPGLLLHAQKQAAMVTALWKQEDFLLSTQISQGCRRELVQYNCCSIVDQFEIDKPRHTHSLLSFGIRFFRATLSCFASSPPPRIIRASHYTHFSVMQRCSTLVIFQVSLFPSLFYCHDSFINFSYKTNISCHVREELLQPVFKVHAWWDGPYNLKML